MFSDMERAQSWQVQQQQQYASATERQSQSGWFPLEDALVSSQQPHPQHQVYVRGTMGDVYSVAEEPLMAPHHQHQHQPQHEESGRWPPASDHPYVPDVGRLSVPPPRPDPMAAMYSNPQQHPQAYASSSSGGGVHEMGMAVVHTPGAGASGVGPYAAWPHDSRLPSSSVSGPGIVSVHSSSAMAEQFEEQYPHVVHGMGLGLGMGMARHHSPMYHHQQQQHESGHPHARRKAKEISIGRWNADEHKWFLKGLEMFQGPAWGEIARLIGTRTSTQVRTHAQKFFTKLARMNQTLPYFDAQIQKERARLLTQGGGLGASSSVTPTATSSGGFNYALSNLSPRKRVSGSNSPSHLALKQRDAHESSSFSSSHYSGVSLAGEYQTARMPGYDELAADKMRTGGGGNGVTTTVTAYYHHSADDGGSGNPELFKPKYDLSGGMSPLLRKPRMYVDASGHLVSSLGAVDQLGQGGGGGYEALPPHPQQQHMAYGSVSTHLKDEFDASRQHYTTAIDASQLSHNQHDHHHQQQQQQHTYSRRDDAGYSSQPPRASEPLAACLSDPWSGEDASQSPWLAGPSPSSTSQLESSSNSSGGGVLDAESLPSMNKLLFRGAA